MAAKEKRGAQPEVVAQVAVDVQQAEDRWAQGVKRVVAFRHRAQLKAAAVVPEAVREEQRNWPAQLAQRVVPRPARLVRPMAAAPRVLPWARQELAVPRQVPREQVSVLQEEQSPDRQQVRLEAQKLRASPQELQVREPGLSPPPAPGALPAAGVR